MDPVLLFQLDCVSQMALLLSCPCKDLLCPPFASALSFTTATLVLIH